MAATPFPASSSSSPIEVKPECPRSASSPKAAICRPLVVAQTSAASSEVRLFGSRCFISRPTRPGSQRLLRESNPLGKFRLLFSDTNQLHLTLRNNTSDAGIPGAMLQGLLIFSRATARRFFPPTPAGSSPPAPTGITSSWARTRTLPAQLANQGDTFPFDSLLTFNRAAFNPQSSYVAQLHRHHRLPI
jgi:hypothetical protein